MIPQTEQRILQQKFSSISLYQDDSKSLTFFRELKLFLGLSFPMIIMAMSRYANPLISIIMCGRLSKEEFDASSLANSIINVFGITIDLGFSTALDTIFSQTYGSINKKKMGFILQRAIIVMTIIYLILICFHINMEPILILLQQDFTILRLTSKYVLIFLPGLFFDFQFLAISRYLQNQNIVFPMMISSICGCVFNALSQYIAIWILGFRIEASSFLQAFSCFVTFSIQLIYVLMTKVYVNTWSGFNLQEALSEWKIFFKLGIPGIIMLAVESWAFEAIMFVAGTFGEIQLGGQSIAWQVELFALTINGGFGLALLIRVGQSLGANKPKNALKSIKVAFSFCLLVSVIIVATIGFGRKSIANIFTNDMEILAVGERLLILIAGIQIFDTLNTLLSGVIRACSKHFIGAIIMTITYFVIGIPLGIVLISFVNVDIMSMWLGLITGFIVETILFLFIAVRTNFKEECKKIQLTSSGSGSYMETEIMVTEFDVEEDIEDDSDSFLCDRNNESKCLLKNENKTNHSFNDSKKLLLKRTWQLSIVISILLMALFIRIFLPPSLYIPCIPNNFDNSSAIQLLRQKHYPMCNDSTVFY